MKKLIALFALCFAFSSQATVIKVELDKAKYDVNELVEATIRVQGYTQGMAGFKLDLSYWATALGFQSVVFGPHFSPVTASSNDVVKNGNILTISDMNYLDYDYELADVQSADFVAATVIFKALGGGLHQLVLSNIELTDGFGSAIDNFSVGQGVVNVTGPAIPAPATALLLLPALLLLQRRRR